MGSWASSITSQCDNPDAAWAFVDYLLTPEQILHTTDQNGAIPGRQTALAQSNLYGEGGLLNVFIQQLNEGVDEYAHPGHAGRTRRSPSTFYQGVDDILKGAGVQTTLDKVADAIDEDLAANHGYPAQP